MTPKRRVELRRRGEGRRDRGESRLIEMVLQHARRVYVRVLSSTAVRAKADYGMELTLVGENSFTGKFLSPPDIKRRGRPHFDGVTQHGDGPSAIKGKLVEN